MNLCNVRLKFNKTAGQMKQATTRFAELLLKKEQQLFKVKEVMKIRSMTGTSCYQFVRRKLIKNGKPTPSEFAICSLISSLYPHWNSSDCQHASFKLKCYCCLPLIPHLWRVLQEDVINTQCGYDVREKSVSLALLWLSTLPTSVWG